MHLQPDQPEGCYFSYFELWTSADIETVGRGAWDEWDEWDEWDVDVCVTNASPQFLYLGP